MAFHEVFNMSSLYKLTRNRSKQYIILIRLMNVNDNAPFGSIEDYATLMMTDSWLYLFIMIKYLLDRILTQCTSSTVQIFTEIQNWMHMTLTVNGIKCIYYDEFMKHMQIILNRKEIKRQVYEHAFPWISI